jgi:thioredoxin-dependent peroxiredoxin
MVVEGKAAPVFDLAAEAGGRVNLASLRGAPLVLFFYPADDTETCTLEAQQFSAAALRFKAAGARVFGISPDGVASHCKFRDKYGLKVPLLADEDLKTCKAYGVWTEKTLFGRTYMGVERTTVLIDGTGRAARVWRKVRLKGHVEAVLEAVAALSSTQGNDRA